MLWPAGKKRREVYWTCRCDCGKVHAAPGKILRNRGTRSCGCLRRDMAARRVTVHGYAKRGQYSPEYNAFMRAKNRCNCQTTKDWINYGGRGIEFRFESFKQFLAELGLRPEGMTLDRIDVNGHYEPGNVRWATRTEQNRNQRRNKLNGGKVAEIRKLAVLGMPKEKIAALFRVHPAMVCRIACGKSWSMEIAQ